MKNQFISIEDALIELQAGRMVILVDDEHREQEGDLVIAAEKVTPEAINFFTQFARGVVCLTLAQDIVERLRIPLMPARNSHPDQAAFTFSIEAANGVATGVSAYDRAHTIQVAIDPKTTPYDISIPGHVFPLQARNGGVLERPGHTEGSVDLARLAGLKSAAVICEVMKFDGTMARLPDLIEFSKEHHVKLVSINDLIEYRMKHEITVDEIASKESPIKVDPEFTFKIFKDRYHGSEHLALIHKKTDFDKPVLAYIHTECLLGDVFGSLRCDCHHNLTTSLQKISEEGGIVLYMRPERPLSEKLCFDKEANLHASLLADQRYYGLSAQIFRSMNIQEIRLISPHSDQAPQLEKYGIRVE